MIDKKHYIRKAAYLLILLSIIFINYNSEGKSYAPSKHFELNSDVGSPQIKFISKAPIEDIRGNVQPDKISGHVNIDLENLQAANGIVIVKVNGMETGIHRRNEDMRSKAWLDESTYPTISFELKKLNNAKISGDKNSDKVQIKADADGMITIHGKNKNISVPVNITYIKESNESKKRASGDLLLVEGNFDVALKDFNITGVKGLVGSRVGEIIKIEFKLFYSSNNKS